MTDGLDFEVLRRRLESRFGIALYKRVETVDGGEYEAIRPTGLELGNGFAVLLSRTHRQFEASFKADNFAGALLREMSEASDEQKRGLARARETALKTGTIVYLAVNGNDGEACLGTKERWSRVEIDVSRRFQADKCAENTVDTAFLATSTCLAMVIALTGTGEQGEQAPDSSARGLPEGAKIRVEVNRYERSPLNRSACIDHYGLRCKCCDFDFKEAYGELGEGYIEVHHRTPVSQLGDDYIVDPVKDLVPLCGNCHAMVHRSDPPLDVADLQTVLKTSRKTPSPSDHVGLPRIPGETT